jgi:hypothetical protein
MSPHTNSQRVPIRVRALPDKVQFLARIAAYDGHNGLYFEALNKLKAEWGNPAKMADAIWPWLRNWHADFYRWGQRDPGSIALVIKEHWKELDALHQRSIDTLSSADEPTIRRLFWSFTKATGRRNAQGFDTSPVGAAKVLHSLCPNILPLWDDKIAGFYRCDLDAFGYVKFCWTMKEMWTQLRQYLRTPDDRSVLKRLDEYNYSSRGFM